MKVTKEEAVLQSIWKPGLPKVNWAQIDPELRAEFEEYGETVVALFVANPLAGSSAEGPRWKQDLAKGKLALAWLREQHNLTELHQWWSMRMEALIVVFVLLEVVLSIWDIVLRFQGS